MHGETQGHTITPDSGIPYMLAPMKLESWIPSESGEPTTISLSETKLDFDEEKLVETNVVRKITFLVGSQSTPILNLINYKRMLMLCEVIDKF